MRRVFALLAFTVGALARRAGRTLSVAFALFLVTAAFASVYLLSESMRAEAARGVTASPDLTVSALRAGRPAFVDVADAERLRDIAGVSRVQPRVWGYLYLEGIAANLTVVGTDNVPRDVSDVVAGQLPSEGQRGWIVVGEGVAQTLGLAVGDGLGLDAPGGGHVDLTLQAEFRASSSIRTADVALMDTRDARTLLGVHDNEATDLVVQLSNRDESALVARKISALLPGARVVEQRTLRRAYDLTFGTRGGLLALAMVPALIAMLVLAWDRATGLSAQERREIGVLKTVGWSNRDVVLHKLMESGLVAGVASTLGVMFAYVYVFVFRAPGLLRAMVGWSAFHGQFKLVPASGTSTMIAITALSAVPYLCASVVPSWRAATMDPAEALRES